MKDGRIVTGRMANRVVLRRDLQRRRYRSGVASAQPTDNCLRVVRPLRGIIAAMCANLMDLATINRMFGLSAGLTNGDRVVDRRSKDDGETNRTPLCC